MTSSRPGDGAPPASPSSPYFEKAGAGADDPAARRRLLLVSQHFPPSNSVGALRWQMLARFAAERGWGLDVVTLDPAGHEGAVDLARLEALPPGTRVYTVPIVRSWIERLTYDGWRPVTRLRAALAARLKRRSAAPVEASSAGGSVPFAPPPRPTSIGRAELAAMRREPRDVVRAYFAWLYTYSTGRWARAAADVAMRIVRPGVHRAVITSGPPHMTHEGGRAVAVHTGLPFVMDLRDPWSLNQRLPEAIASPVWYRLAARYERRAVARAALVVANTEASARTLRELYPDARDRVVTVMNGADDETMPARTTEGGPFVIAYAGTIYLDRDPRLLLRAAARVVRDLRLTPEQLSLRFMGDADAYDVLGVAREEGLPDGFVVHLASRPRREALRFLADAALLVSLPQDSDMAIPAKIFDYAQFGAWVLVLADATSATGVLLAGTGADVVAPHDADAIEAVIRKRYDEYARGTRPPPLNADGRFSRRNQAKILFDALDRITG